MTRKLTRGLIHFAKRAHEFTEILAVARGVIEGVEAGVHGRFRQGDTPALGIVGKNDFVPLD